jgi:hypothetical protein
MRDQAARSQRKAEEACVRLRWARRAPGPPGSCRREFLPLSLFRVAIADCGAGPRAGTLRGNSKKGAPREAPYTTGDDVLLNSYLPTTFTTLFVLAAGLLLGYIQ